MRQSQKKKATLRKQRVVRIAYERDYSDEAWQSGSGSVPTPESHPDAFYRKVVEVNAPRIRKSTRLKPHDTLSKRQLAKRLHRVGLEGRELRRIVAEIKQGQGLGFLGGVRVLDWGPKELRQRYGRRVANAVLKFVLRRFFVMDESWSLFSNSGTAKVLSDSMHTLRKVNSGGKGYAIQAVTDFGLPAPFPLSPDDAVTPVALLS
jgi:hypothetical protein